MPAPTNRNSSNTQMQNQNDQDDESIGSDEWNPSTSQFEAFLKRDFALASNNVRLALTGSRPMTLRDIKESTLHSNDVIERVLTSKVASGSVSEEKGRYSLISK